MCQKYDKQFFMSAIYLSISSAFFGLIYRIYYRQLILSVMILINGYRIYLSRQGFFRNGSNMTKHLLFDSRCIEKAKKNVANYVKVVMLVFEV